MKIRRLTVRNFRGLDGARLDFTDEDGRVRPLTVLVGPNRSGKTTFLDALHLVYASLINARQPSLRPAFDPDDPRLRPDLRFRDVRTDTTYYLAGTSSGERMLLRIVASLTAFGLRRSVVLIDEIEQHLHPRWQRSLLHFCRAGYEGDTQFIVTTHSDSILRYVDPAAVISLGELDS